MTQALAANTDLRVAAANIARAQASVDVAEEGRRPQATLQAAPGYGQRSAEEELLPGAPLPRNFVYSATAGIAYQVDLVGQVRRAIEAADADLAATRAAYDGVRVTVAADTTRAYLDACSAGREIGVAQRALTLQSRTTALTRRLVRRSRHLARRHAIGDAGGAGAGDDAGPAGGAATRALPVGDAHRRPPAEFDRDVAACAAEPRLTRPIPIGDGASLLAVVPMCAAPNWNCAPRWRGSGSLPAISIPMSRGRIARIGGPCRAGAVGRYV